MDTIIVKIPKGLSQEQELKELETHLGKKYLPISKKIRSKLGMGYKVKKQNTEILVRRKEVEETKVYVDCDVCHTRVEKKDIFTAWINYGNTRNRRRYCSEHCCQQVINVLGEDKVKIKNYKNEKCI